MPQGQSGFAQNASVQNSAVANQFGNTGAAFGGFGAGDAGTQNVQSFAQAPIAEQTQSEPQKTGGIPNGLPRLSMLDSMERESGVGGGGEGFASPSSNSFDSAEGNSSHPFYNGGSLPPEQTVDGADDEWLDTETPPEEDSYSAEEYENQVLDSYENSAEAGGNSFGSFGSFGNNFAGQTQGAAAQTEETFTLPDGRTISIAQLRGNVTATLSVEKGFIVAVLEKTGLWEVSDGGVETTIESNLDYSILQKNKHLISEEISKICGKNMYFNVKLQEVQNQNINETREFPLQVKILVDVFRGTVV